MKKTVYAIALSMTVFAAVSVTLSAHAVVTSKKSAQTNVSTVTVPQAQPASNGFRFSRVTPKLALMSSNTDGDVVGNDSRNGIHVGVLAEVATPIKSFAVESGVAYEQMGFSNKAEIANDTFTVGARLNYLKIPAYAKYYLPMTVDTKVYIKGGPSLGFLVSKTQFSESKDKNSEEDIKSEEINTVQLAAELGAGVYIPAGENDITVEWGFTRGINRVNAKGNQSFYNSAFNVGVGYSFSL